MPVDVITFGCRLNAYESGVMKSHALAAGLSDTLIFNTCAVTAEAEAQARKPSAREKGASIQTHRRHRLRGAGASGRVCGDAGSQRRARKRRENARRALPGARYGARAGE